MYLVNVRKAQKSNIKAIKKCGDILHRMSDSNADIEDLDEVAQLLNIIEQEIVTDDELEKIYVVGYEDGVKDKVDEMQYDMYNNGYEDALEGLKRRSMEGN